jgi:hypothetical protein
MICRIRTIPLLSESAKSCRCRLLLASKAELTPQLQERIVEGVLEEADGQSIDELAAQRDEMLFELIAVRTKHAPPRGPRA